MMIFLTAAFTLAQMYWLVVILIAFGGGWGIYQRWRTWWPGLLLFVLLAIIGLAIFGMPFATTK